MYSPNQSIQTLLLDRPSDCPFSPFNQPCPYSETSIKIIRRLIENAERPTQRHPQLDHSKQPLSKLREANRDNPYVFKPRSYSTKRNLNSEGSGPGSAVQGYLNKNESYGNDMREPLQTGKIMRIYEKHSIPSKKVKLDKTAQEANMIRNIGNPVDGIDLNVIDNTVKNININISQNSYFAWSSQTKVQKNQNDSSLGSNLVVYQNNRREQPQKFPISLTVNPGKVLKKSKNQMLGKTIEIVSNKNVKISVPVHQGLLNANTTQNKLGKNQHCFDGVSNPYNLQKFNNFARKIPFIKDYKNGYAPIQLQMKNHDDIQDYGSIANNHFIRKKQSTLTLPRTCGVSYIKKSESHQGAPFEPLPPLIFQCSSVCVDSPQQRQKYRKEILQFIEYAENSWFPYIKTQENLMRELLLSKGQKNNRKGTVGWVNGIQNVWPLLNDGVFILLLIGKNPPISQEKVWKFLDECAFKIGILGKKSTSGKKSFLKSIGVDNYIDEDQNQNQTQTQGAFTQEQTQTKQLEKDVVKIQVAGLKNSQSRSEEEKQSTVIKEQIKEQNAKVDIPEQIQKVESEKEKQDKDKAKKQTHKKSDISVLSEQLKNQLKDCRAVLTLSIRLQLYVNDFDWKNKYSFEDKNLLNLLITTLKEDLQKKSLPIIKQRLDLSKTNEKQAFMADFMHNLRIPCTSFEQTDQFPNKQLFSVAYLSELLDTSNSSLYETRIIQETKKMSYDEMIKQKKNQSLWQKSLKMPIYYISTRDSFAFDLIQKWTKLKREGENSHTYDKIQYFFDKENLPTNFSSQYRKKFPESNVGITCYHNFFTDEQLKRFQKSTFQTEEKAFKNNFLQMTVQPSIVNTKVKRTKFFFGYRYMWTKCQLAESTSYVAAGVRKDVTCAPKWTKQIENIMVENRIVQKNFLNAVSINVYHDGKQGLAQHFDDAVRFKQPIFTLRLFSDARLSFGSQLYGFCNGAFIIPMPRGCITVMQESSYAANGVKHCVRPCDMTGKSAAIILRQMHHQVIQEASRYDQKIDFPAWMSTLIDQDDYLKVNRDEQVRESAKISSEKEVNLSTNDDNSYELPDNQSMSDQFQGGDEQEKQVCQRNRQRKVAMTYAEQKKRVVEYSANDKKATLS